MDELTSKYLDHCYAMSHLCSKTSSYYDTIKKVIEIPLIFTSSTLALLNSSFGDGETLKILNIIINCLTAILINVQSRMRISELASQTKSLAQAFDKLQGEIQKTVTFNQMTEDKLSAFIQAYDTLVTQCPVFPRHIRDKMSKTLKNIDLPYLFNGYIEKKSVIGSTTNLQSDIIIE